MAAGLGLAGAILAVVAWFSVVIKIQVLTVTTATFKGSDRSGVALLLLAGFGLLMLVGAVRGARPAMAALGLVGLAVLLIAVLVDLPHLNDTGVWPLHDSYEDAQASAGSGYYLETAAGVLMMLGGAALMLLAPRRGPRGVAPPAPPREQAPRERVVPTPAVAAPAPVAPPPAAAPRVPPPAEDPDYAPRTRPERHRSGGIVGRLRRRD